MAHFPGLTTSASEVYNANPSVEFVSESEQYGGGFFSSQSSNDSKFLRAFKQRNGEVVRFMLKNDMISSLACCDCNGNTVLHYAVQDGNSQMVEYLTRHASRRGEARQLLDAQNKAGDTALHLAVRAQHAPLVDALISAGADTSIQNNAGQRVERVNTCPSRGHARGGIPVIRLDAPNSPVWMYGGSDGEQVDEYSSTSAFLNDVQGWNAGVVHGSRQIGGEYEQDGGARDSGLRNRLRRLARMTKEVDEEAKKLNQAMVDKIMELMGYGPEDREKARAIRAELFNDLRKENPDSDNMVLTKKLVDMVNKKNVNKKKFSDSKMDGLLEARRKRRAERKSKRRKDRKPKKMSPSPATEESSSDNMFA